MLLLWIIYVISVLFLLCFRGRLFIDALWSPAGRGLPSWLSFVMSNCEVVSYPLVSWVRCGAWLYRFLIFALFLTFYIHVHKVTSIVLGNRIYVFIYCSVITEGTKHFKNMLQQVLGHLLETIILNCFRGSISPIHKTLWILYMLFQCY